MGWGLGIGDNVKLGRMLVLEDVGWRRCWFGCGGCQISLAGSWFGLLRILGRLGEFQVGCGI